MFHNLKSPYSYTVGTIGYSAKPFDEAAAEGYLRSNFERINRYYGHLEVWVASGLTNVGIPKISYKLATEFGFKTLGICSKKALGNRDRYPWFDCDRIVLEGDEWSSLQPSQELLKVSDEIIRVGGNEGSGISMEEAKQAKWFKLPITEYDMPLLEV